VPLELVRTRSGIVWKIFGSVRSAFLVVACKPYRSAEVLTLTTTAVSACILHRQLSVVILNVVVGDAYQVYTKFKRKVSLMLGSNESFFSTYGLYLLHIRVYMYLCVMLVGFCLFFNATFIRTCNFFQRSFLVLNVSSANSFSFFWRFYNFLKAAFAF